MLSIQELILDWLVLLRRSLLLLRSRYSIPGMSGALQPEKERTLEEQKEFKTFEHLITKALNKAPRGALALQNIIKAINAEHPQYTMENLDW